MSKLVLPGNSGYFNPDFFNGEAPELPPINLQEKVTVGARSDSGTATVEEVLDDFSVRYPDDELFFVDSNRLLAGVEILGRHVIDALQSGQGEIYLSVPEKDTPLSADNNTKIRINSGWYLLGLLMPILERAGTVSSGSVRILPFDTNPEEETYTIPRNKDNIPVLILDDWIGSGDQIGQELKKFPRDYPVSYATIASRLTRLNWLEFIGYRGTSTMYSDDGAILTGSHCSMDTIGGIPVGKGRADGTPLIKSLLRPYKSPGYSLPFSFDEKGKITIH